MCARARALQPTISAGRRNPGLVLQLRLSWAMVYFGSSTFLGFVMTVARDDWLDCTQRGGTLVQGQAPTRSRGCKRQEVCRLVLYVALVPSNEDIHYLNMPGPAGIRHSLHGLSLVHIVYHPVLVLFYVDECLK